MKISLAKNSGFCFGVKKALEKVEEIKNQEAVYILGQLIHNKQVIDALEKNGIKIIDKIDDVNKGTIVISAHGVSDKLMKEVDKKNLKIIDTTCPLVEKVHIITKKLEKEGYNIIIYGDKEHTEVKGIAGNLKNPIIINDVSEMSEMLCISEHAQKPPKVVFDIKDLNKKYALISQTTKDQEKFNEIAEKLKQKIKDLRVEDTICSATKLRQNDAKELAKNVDMMIVIGDYKSANTKRLDQICSKIVKTKHIETADDLNREWFKDKKHIGITAGASTPDWIIEKVIERIKNDF